MVKKVLLSAYACEPGKGSEPGVGWHWAIEIARLGHEVIVLTRKNNKALIEQVDIDSMRLSGSIRFVYYDLPAWIQRMKRRLNATLIYYALWQVGVFKRAQELHEKEKFTVVHHVTFGGVRHFSSMGKLGIPFILGPLGGGETSPFWLRWRTGIRGGLRDSVRDGLNAVSLCVPWFQRATKQASLILIKTPESRWLFPYESRLKVKVRMEAGIDFERIQPSSLSADSRCKNVLYAGNFLYLKGMSIGIRAFAKALEKDHALRLTLVGKGPEEKRWRRLARSLKIEDRITWVPWVTQSELQCIYANHGLLLFPSLHDTSGNVVLEALAHGLPVVCLKLGGPGEIVNQYCGYAIDTSHRDFSKLVEEMALSINEITKSPEAWAQASISAAREVRKWSWSDRVVATGVY